ncbi:hypothetical protein CaCOL14_012065 [Colletotrichum acutatum]
MMRFGLQRGVRARTYLSHKLLSKCIVPKSQVRIPCHISHTKMQRHEGKVSNLKVSVSVKSGKKLTIFCVSSPEGLSNQSNEGEEVPRRYHGEVWSPTSSPRGVVIGSPGPRRRRWGGK